ncbi:MAG: 3' terminal RNA ribose 2'-O-methyltransferase Hen1 [Paracoccaceae bacterium]|nr:3' terminal RNA ribose 2'-O-methyltransferase Hen1 [Paracoccaceae bacterium]
MQIEITLTSADPADYPARDLGFLLHKHPDHLHQRDTAVGRMSIFFPDVGEARCRAVLHLSVDPVALVRGRLEKGDGLLAQYVNDRPYAANSLLSVAMARAIGQTMAGKSKERQWLADRALPFELRVVPVAVSGGLEVIERLFLPLVYAVEAVPLDESGRRAIFDLRLSTTARLAEILSHLYVLVPVLDNAKHYWIDAAEVEKLLAKGGDWLPAHPEKDMIARRALKHRRGLVEAALDRLSDALPEEDGEEAPAAEAEEVLEKPIRLHDLRLDAVRDAILAAGARSVLDLGCGEGKLIRRLKRERGIDRICGVDPSVRALEIARRRLYLDEAGEAMAERIRLQMGSLTYGDRRWQGFDAATLVEVIEHIDPPRLSALELSLFGDARPGLVVVTTPNREYNALFEGMAEGQLRHRDHRFEWTRAEFGDWAARVAGAFGYTVETGPLGPFDDTHGAPSQIAVFRRVA